VSPFKIDFDTLEWQSTLPGARQAAAPLPVRVTFPAVGPSLYLVSQLTGESKAPVVNLAYQKEKKGGVK